MDKFGVEVEPEEKTAQEKGKASPGRCPACKAPLRPLDETGVPLCPRCGSKPFEQR